MSEPDIEKRAAEVIQEVIWPTIRDYPAGESWTYSEVANLVTAKVVDALASTYLLTDSKSASLPIQQWPAVDPEFLRFCDWPGCFRAYNILTGPDPEVDGSPWRRLSSGVRALFCPDHGDVGHMPQSFEWERGRTTLAMSCECGERVEDLSPTTTAACLSWWQAHVLDVEQRAAESEGISVAAWLRSYQRREDRDMVFDLAMALLEHDQKRAHAEMEALGPFPPSCGGIGHPEPCGECVDCRHGVVALNFTHRWGEYYRRARKMLMEHLAKGGHLSARQGVERVSE